MKSLTAFAARRPWLVIAGWLLVLAALTLGIPQLNAVVEGDGTPVVPDAAPAKIALSQMDHEFGSGRSVSVVYVAVERESGLTDADRAWAVGLTKRLAADTKDVSFVQALSGRPELVKALTSHDGKAMYIQVGTPGATGAPNSIAEITSIRSLVHDGEPAGLNVQVTGPSATITDLSTGIEHSILLITIVTVIVIALLLLLIYRSIAVTVLVLSFVGIGLGVARQVVAWCGLHFFAVSTFTNSFVTAVVLGAGTDYAIFLLARFHERVRAGDSAQAAAAEAGSKVASVVVGSALTVIVANASMALADVGIYRTTGPAIAVAVFTTLLLSLTLVPALLRVFGDRGWLAPRTQRASLWPRLAALVTTYPARTLALGLIPLVLLAAFYPLLRPSTDEAASQPATTESNQGLALLDRHFPNGEVMAHVVLITTDHDLRNARDLAAIQQASAALARTSGVTSVRSLTQPLGAPLFQASVGYQAGQVGNKLQSASTQVQQNSTRTQALVTGTSALAGGTGTLANGARQAVAGAGQLTDAIGELQTGLASLVAGSRKSANGADQLRSGAAVLAAGLDAAYAQTQVAVNGLGQASAALQQSLTCGLDPVCTAARNGVAQVYVGERDKLLPGLSQAAAGAHRLASGAGSLKSGLDQLTTGLRTAQSGSGQIRDGQATLESKLGLLADGAAQAHSGATQVKTGTVAVTGALKQLSGGMSQAAAYLRQAGAVSKDPAVGGFYLPPEALASSKFSVAIGQYLSHDAHTTRLIVLGSADPMSSTASDVAAGMPGVVETALRGTSLAHAHVQVTGQPAIDADLVRMSADDFELLAIISLLAVFLILLVLLRSLVAATFLLASVVLSFAAAMGLGVIVWQYVLGHDLDWTVTTIAFILLVAVGADYNLLLTKRMHEEAPNGEREGIARAVVATGSVITTAGIIFAASMFALMSGSTTGLAQTGSIIGCGLLIDTVVVRSLVVPAVATLLGPRLWWPTGRPRRGATAPEPRREPIEGLIRV